MIALRIALALGLAAAFVLVIGRQLIGRHRYPPARRGDAPASEYGIRTVPLTPAEYRRLPAHAR